jgi:putative redox protein
MVKIKSTYQGKKHCLALHEPSGSLLETDAPKDNQGLGERFSPTDLMATALGTCILTTIAIVTERDGLNIEGSNITVEKIMNPNPRKIASLHTVLEMPKNIPEEYRQKIQNTAQACPVKKSLHESIAVDIEIRYIL